MQVSRKKNGVVRYQCQTSAKRSDCGCRYHVIRADESDAITWQRVMGTLLDPSRLRAEINRLRESEPSADELMTLDEALRRMREEERNLTDAIMSAKSATAIATLTERLNGVADKIAVTK
jgi:hypothetical protein